MCPGQVVRTPPPCELPAAVRKHAPLPSCRGSVVTEKRPVPPSPTAPCSPPREKCPPKLMLQTARRPCSKTTAIIDWDDTICPSTYLASLGLRVDDRGSLPAVLRTQLEQLEEAVVEIVKEALRFGKVVIITNAEAGWVELSGRRFLPRVVNFLVENDIKIVSARTSFESDYPDAPSSWKVAAFSQEVAVMFPNEDELNVLVLGDSMSERDAAHALSTRLPNSRVKTVKFVERPSIDQLMRQVQLVAQSLPDLATYASSFDVDLVVSASA
ncbi:unnamed protein product [Agarophyton chilense]|eukprot:gb/GEZJ01000033.1/.p1 GENE.gb/GEZJ01000033.1/~~gb/GEZJ01000033.1/.p1  ORF type:complete len:270 (-),score=40.49 gb/GEZJ01000033.1/:1384-2193(-)